MKTIRANDVKIEASPRLRTGKNIRVLVKEFICINMEHIQYVKAEKEENIIGTDM